MENNVDKILKELPNEFLDELTYGDRGVDGEFNLEFKEREGLENFIRRVGKKAIRLYLDYLIQRECKHKKLYGKTIGKFPNDKIQRICCHCEKIVDEIEPQSSGVVI